MTRTPLLRAAVAFGLIALAAFEARAEQTRVATTSPFSLQSGESEGVAITSRGRLFVAPRIVALGKPSTGPLAAQVFAAVSDAAGNVFLATGPDGSVFKVTPTGELTPYFRADQPLVTAVALLPGGDLLAATAPGGVIYRVRPSGQGTVWCETGERYVWALLVAPDGVVFAATGERGRLLKIDRSGKAAIFFDSDETHLVSLANAAGGGLWAGGAGNGLVYRIDAEGRGLVVYDDELPEAKAVVVDSTNSLVVAFDAPPVSERRPPAVRIRMSGGAGAGPAEGMGDLDARETPAIQGVIEGLPSQPDDESVRLRGKIVRVAPDGTASELWRSTDEAPFALALDERDRPIFATGEPARLWRVESVTEVALLATLKEAQATALVPGNAGIVAATSNPAATYRIETATAGAGTYLAPTSDAGGIARWGRLTWRTYASGGRVELFTRTGNSEDPDATWSAWSPALTDAAGDAISNPDGRFLQWRIHIAGATGEGPRLGGVAATYATHNRPPVLRDLRVDPAGGAVAAKATLRWSVSDPDGDGVAVDVQVRVLGTAEWKSAARSDPTSVKPSDPTLGNDGSAREGKATWDTVTWEEGAYELRAVASDQAANPPGEGLDAIAELPTVLRLDRTPPSIEAKRAADGGVDIVVLDTASTVARVELIEGASVISSPRPKDGVCDGTREVFHLSKSEAGTTGTRSLRATDSAGNTAEVAVPEP